MNGSRHQAAKRLDKKLSRLRVAILTCAQMPTITRHDFDVLMITAACPRPVSGSFAGSAHQHAIFQYMFFSREITRPYTAHWPVMAGSLTSISDTKRRHAEVDHKNGTAKDNILLNFHHAGLMVLHV